MAIQNRRGDYSDFDPQKMVPGEWAVVLSGDPNSERGRAVYMAFDVGEIERMATYEDMQENIVSATTDVQAQFASELTQTINDANTAVSTMRHDIDAEIDSAVDTVNNLTLQVNTATGNARVATEQANQAADTAYNAADSIQAIIDSGTTVASWNNRTGLVVPQSGDYNSAQITHNSTTVEDALDFDSVPTANSNRAVKSGGVFSILGNTPLGTTATTISGAVSELNDRTTTTTATPQVYTDGIQVVSEETTLTKYGGFVECKLRFTIISTQALPADKQLFLIPSGFRPAKVIRLIVHDWNLGQPRRFNIFPTGEVKTVDSTPTGLQFIITVVYAV